ncbi:hypothetical protein F4780DRAFT_758880 [Xylariomycetidae sp. FL0641]|nr:hypothetical protein F4780DRAFT_758880 [Xylariomycetidae sp. FL0641]
MSLGPLTTSFSPPTDCFQSNVNVARVGTGSTNNYFFTAGAAPLQSSCFPSAGCPAYSEYYSPGVCPSGYSWACSDRSTASVSVVEMMAHCCPTFSDFKCNTGTFSFDNWGVIADCTAITDAVALSPTIASLIENPIAPNASRNAAGDVVIAGNLVINAYGIQVRWQQTDEALLGLNGSTTSSSASSSSPTSSFIDASTPPSAAPTVTTSSDSQKESTVNVGAIAGATVGAMVGFVLIIGMTAWVWRKKRRERSQRHGAEKVRGEIVSRDREEGTGGHDPEPLQMAASELPVTDANVYETFARTELPVPAPTGVIPRQELPTDAAQITESTRCQLVSEIDGREVVELGS